MINIRVRKLEIVLKNHALWVDSDGLEGERADLADADLADAMLRAADLRRADLTYANLTCADLTGSNLTYVDLTYAKLTGSIRDEFNTKRT